MHAPDDLHELLSFEDPSEHRTWVFDLTFLLSPWHCVYGRGCPGVLTEPAPELEQGCCSYGAHFVDDADHERVTARIDALSQEQWQFKRTATARGGATRQATGGQWVTRIHQGACILLNRPGFGAGAGCALHAAATEAGDQPLTWKPDVCWQLPLRLEEHTDDNGYITSTLREWKRRDWGDGGAEFSWWCTDDPLAFDGGRPAYEELREEIIAMIGQEPYDLFVEQVDARLADGRPVAHPAVRSTADR